MNCRKCGRRIKASLIPRYHYKESGLDTVYLVNSVVIHKCTCGEKFIEVRSIERLQDAIAYDLLKKRTLWTGKEFRFLRKWIGLTAEEVGAALGKLSRVTISRWENDKVRITAATHHQMVLLVLRRKEQVINQRMWEEIEITEFFEQIAEGSGKPARITITPDSMKQLPFPSSAGASKPVPTANTI